MTAFDELLGTKDEEVQIAIVKDLLEQEKNKSYAMLIRYDLQQDGVDVSLVGGAVPFTFLYRMLELANKAVRLEEIEVVKKSTTQEPKE